MRIPCKKETATSPKASEECARTPSRVSMAKPRPLRLETAVAINRAIISTPAKIGT